MQHELRPHIHRSTSIAAGLLAMALVASCGAGSDTASQLSSTGQAGEATTDQTTSVDDAPADAPVDDEQADPETADPYAADDADAEDAAPATTGIDIDPSWMPLLEPRFVSQAPLGALVSLYAEPDTGAELVGTVMAGEVGITLYDVVEVIDGRTWSPVQTSGGTVGWMKTNILRPEPSVSPPERIGDSPLRGTDVVRRAVAGLSAPEVLAGQIDERGLTVSATAFIDDEAVVLDADQLRTPADDDTEIITWGAEPGSGEPITATMTERFLDLAGSTAITSTEATGFNVQVGVGNIPSNVSSVFPDAEWVEYHFSGTEAFGGLDWESITFVFDTTGETPVLLAITHSAWAP